MTRSMTPRDAAKALGISPDTLRRWEREGLIQSARTPGGQRRYDQDEIQGLLRDGGRHEPAPSATTATVQHFPQLTRSVDAEGTIDRSSELPVYEHRVMEERAKLEVMKIRLEESDLLQSRHIER